MGFIRIRLFINRNSNILPRGDLSTSVIFFPSYNVIYKIYVSVFDINWVLVTHKIVVEFIWNKFCLTY